MPRILHFEHPLFPMPLYSQDSDRAAYLQSILDTAVDGIVIIDARGIICAFNQAAVKMFGFEPAEAIGQSVNMLMPDPFKKDHDEYMAKFMKTGVAKIIGIGREVVGLRKDTTVFPVRLAVSEVKSGVNRTFIGIVRDISEEKALQKEVLNASEREQCRIGLDLHDGLCQELAGVNLRVQMLQQKMQRGQTISTDDTAEVTSLLQDALRHARGLSRSLYPVGPEPEGLPNALEHLAENTRELRKVQCTFQYPKPIQVGNPSTATHLYRIAQEAVRNAFETWKAKEAVIRLVDTAEAIELSIRASGLTLSQIRQLNYQMNLRIIEHRARAIGAEFRLESRSGFGVAVTCRLPRHHSDAH